MGDAHAFEIRQGSAVTKGQELHLPGCNCHIDSNSRQHPWLRHRNTDFYSPGIYSAVLGQVTQTENKSRDNHDRQGKGSGSCFHGHRLAIPPLTILAPAMLLS